MEAAQGRAEAAMGSPRADRAGTATDDPRAEKRVAATPFAAKRRQVPRTVSRKACQVKGLVAAGTPTSAPSGQHALLEPLDPPPQEEGGERQDDAVDGPE